MENISGTGIPARAYNACGSLLFSPTHCPSALIPSCTPRGAAPLPPLRESDFVLLFGFAPLLTPTRFPLIFLNLFEKRVSPPFWFLQSKAVVVSSFFFSFSPVTVYGGREAGGGKEAHDSAFFCYSFFFFGAVRGQPHQ